MQPYVYLGLFNLPKSTTMWLLKNITKEQNKKKDKYIPVK